MKTRKFINSNKTAIIRPEDIGRINEVIKSVRQINYQYLKNDIFNEVYERERQILSRSDYTEEEIEKSAKEYAEDELEKRAEYTITTQWEVSCLDGAMRSMENMNELLRYSNTKERAIRALYCSSYGPSIRLNISIENSINSPFRAQIEGQEDNLPNIESKINEIIEAISSGKFGVGTTSSGDIVAFLYGLIILCFFITLGVDVVHPEWLSGNGSHKETENPSLAVLIFIMIIAGPLVIGLFYRIIQDKFFPAVIFAIQQGQIRLQELERSRQIWGGSGALAVFIAIAVSLLFS